MGFLPSPVPLQTPAPAYPAAPILPRCVPVVQHALSCLQGKHRGIFLESFGNAK